MPSSKHKKRRPKYGIYAWPYFVLMTLLGGLGIALIFASIVTKGWLLPSGIVLATVGFYLAFGHYLGIKIYEKRENVFAKELLEFIEPRSNKMILDIGTGTGRTAIAVAKNSAHSMVVGIDIYSKKTIYCNSPRRAYENAEIEGVNEKVSFNYGDVLNIPFRNQCFDAVTAGSILHLFAETKRKHAIQEILRVLSDEGNLIVIEILRTANVTLLYLLSAFFIFQTETYWIKLLQENGLKNIRKAMIGDIAIFCAEK